MSNVSSPVQSAVRAVERGDGTELAALLKQDPALAHATLEPDAHARQRPTLLHRATTDNLLEVAKILLDHGADPNSRVGGCLTPLEMAAWLPTPAMADLLIQSGADVELFTDVPPVEMAVAYQRRPTFKLLAAAGARYDISHTLRLGMMAETRALLKDNPDLARTETAHGLPLCLAVSKPGIFKLLLRYGADVHAEDSFGLTVLKAARIPDSDKIVQMLLQMGVEDDIYGAIAARDERRVRAMLTADPRQAQPVRSWPRRGPIPPVIWAVWSGSVPILEMILREKVHLDIRPNPLNTAIHYGYEEMVRLLLDYGASSECQDCTSWPGANQYPPYRPLSPAPPKPHIPLYVALRGGADLTIIDKLLAAGANPTSTATGWAGLQWPAMTGNLRQVQHLIKRGADLTSPCAESALRLAVQECKGTMIELLIANGVDPHATDDAGLGLLDLIGKADSRPSRDDRERTRALLTEWLVITDMPSAERTERLRARAERIDALIQGDQKAFKALTREAANELLPTAAHLGHDDLVDWIVAQGAEMTIAAAIVLGRTDHVATMLASESALVEGALPRALTEKKKHLPWYEHSPLVIAASCNRTAIIELLLDHGADINRPVGWYQTTALHHAVTSHSTAAVRMLLSRGADVAIRSRNHHLPTALGRNTPLTVSREEIRDLLVDHGANPQEQLPHRPIE